VVGSPSWAGGEPEKTHRSERESRFVSSRGCLDERLLNDLASGRTTRHRSSAGEGNLTLRSAERLAEGLGVDVYVLVAENETVVASEASE
jgi:hypothetical protein